MRSGLDLEVCLKGWRKGACGRFGREEERKESCMSEILKWMKTRKGKLNYEGSWVEALLHYLSKLAPQ